MGIFFIVLGFLLILGIAAYTWKRLADHFKNGLHDFQKKDLKPEMKPEVCFALAEGEIPVAAYESCNLHGIWKADI